MAFKPFEFFRKREKLFVAVLTLVAMFLFIVADPFGSGPNSQGSGPGCGSRLGKWLGQGDWVADVEGEKLDEYDILTQSRKYFALFLYLQSVGDRGAIVALKNLGINDDQQVYDLLSRWKQNEYY